MKINQRIRLAIKGITGQNLANSITGSVLRNYSGQSDFRPTEQVVGITYKAIDKIGMSLSVYEPIVVRKNGDAFENHPMYNLFENPNPNQTASDFIHLYAMLTEIYGETFWYMVRGESTKRVKEIYLLNPASMELKIDSGELVGYVLHKSNGEQIPFELEEIYHDKRPNPFNNWRGMSVLERASTYVDTEITTSVFTLNYMRNNASPSGILSLPNMDKETFRQFASQWREGYEGPENAGKTAFIRGGEATFQAVGATLKDVDAKVTREMAKDDVLMMLEVPKPLLGMTDGNGFGRGNLEALHYIFASEKIEPMMRRLDRIYYTILKTYGGTDSAYDVIHESPIPQDKEFMLKSHTEGVNKWLTVNEIRQQQGLPPIKGYDVMVSETNANATPVIESVDLPVRKITLKKQTKTDVAKKLNDDQESFRKKLVETNDIYEKKIKREISKFANTQLHNVIDRINATGKSYEEWLFNVKDESQTLATALSPIIVDLMVEQSADVANFISGELLTITPEVRATVEQNILRIAGVYNQDTITALEATLSEGQTAGESLTKLKKRVETTFQDAKGYRAERIARTESLRASNTTAEMVYKANGYNTVKWVNNPDACDFCLTVGESVKSIGQNFYNVGDVLTTGDGQVMRIDYSNIQTPPLHPNCKCTIVPEV
jgi:HK97 family phage portal protein